MPHRLAAPAAALVLLPLLAACGSGSSSATAQDTTSPSPSVSPSQSSAETSTANAGTGPKKSCSYEKDPAGAARKVSLPPTKPTVKGKVAVTMATSVGTLKATLNAARTPCTVGSFVSLAKQHFFDDTPCHRLTTQGIYVLQCGDPTGTGTGGPGYTIPDELSGKETYPAGTLAMANTGQPHSGGSQFFLVYKATRLPASYTVFGTVDAAAVRTIQAVAKKGTDNAYGAGDGHPKEKVTITKLTVG